MCDKHFKNMNPNMKIESTTTSDKVSAVASNDRVRPPCCYNCEFMGYTPPQHDQPHPELWCKKEVWAGAEDKEALLLETECKLHKRAD